MYEHKRTSQPIGPGDVVRISLWTFIPPIAVALTFYYMVTYEPCGLGNEPCVWISGTAFLLAALVVGVMTLFNVIRLLGATLTYLSDRKS